MFQFSQSRASKNNVIRHKILHVVSICVSHAISKWLLYKVYLNHFKKVKSVLSSINSPLHLLVCISN